LKQHILLPLNFIIIVSLLIGTVSEIRESVVYSFKAPTSSNVPTSQPLVSNKGIEQTNLINNNTDLSKSNSNFTAITNLTNPSSSLSMNNISESDLVNMEYEDFQDSDSEDVADEIFNDVQAQLKAQGISIPLLHG
jgi:hypothetical protein